MKAVLSEREEKLVALTTLVLIDMPSGLIEHEMKRLFGVTENDLNSLMAELTQFQNEKINPILSKIQTDVIGLSMYG